MAAAAAAPTIDRIFRERFHFEERLHYKAYRLILITDSTESSEILMTAIVRQLINEAHNTSYISRGCILCIDLISFFHGVLRMGHNNKF